MTTLHNLMSNQGRIVTLRGIGLDQRRRIVEIVDETEQGWVGVPIDARPSVLPFPAYHWRIVEQKAGAA